MQGLLFSGLSRTAILPESAIHLFPGLQVSEFLKYCLLPITLASIMCTSSNTFSCFSFQVHYSLCHKLSFTSLISIHASKLISTITSSQKPTQVCPLREYVHRSLRFPWATGHISATTTCSVALQSLITLICSPHWEQKEGREHVLISVIPSSTVVFSTQHSIKVRLKIQANEQINK